MSRERELDVVGAGRQRPRQPAGEEGTRIGRQAAADELVAVEAEDVRLARRRLHGALERHRGVGVGHLRHADGGGERAKRAAVRRQRLLRREDARHQMALARRADHARLAVHLSAQQDAYASSLVIVMAEKDARVLIHAAMLRCDAKNVMAIELQCVLRCDVTMRCLKTSSPSPSRFFSIANTTSPHRNCVVEHNARAHFTICILKYR